MICFRGGDLMKPKKDLCQIISIGKAVDKQFLIVNDNMYVHIPAIPREIVFKIIHFQLIFFSK